MRSRPSPRLVVQGAALALALLGATSARASDPATAQALFDQGRKLMAQERWAEACPKLEESQRLDPAGGTLLHLALCREHEGRTATAWALYQDALAQAKHDARKDRAKVAQERIEALGPRLPHMRVRVALPNRRAEGFTLSRDDVAVGEAQWGESLPVDPGPHVLTARANGRKSWTSRVDVPARPQEVVVDVPELAGEVPDVTKPGERSPGPPPSRLEEATRGDGQRAAGIVLGAVGVAGVAVGSVFGILSFSKNDEADKQCLPPAYTSCTQKGIDAGSSAKTDGNVSTIAFVAGGVLVAGGLVLYLTAPRGGGVALAPSVDRYGAALGLSGRF